jgi:hypothetical protein
MRVAPIALALLGTALFAEPAKADPYPWCAVYGNTGDSRERCYDLTCEACLAQIRGLVGCCNNNPGYTGPAASSGDNRRRPRR